MKFLWYVSMAVGEELLEGNGARNISGDARTLNQGVLNNVMKEEQKLIHTHVFRKWLWLSKKEPAVGSVVKFVGKVDKVV